MSQQLADLLFPDVSMSIAEVQALFPPRPEGQYVTRFAPSPTGFLHIGGVYSSLVAERFVHQGGQNGIIVLRIEDTDQKRQIDDGIGNIVRGLRHFGIEFDEGPLGENYSDVGKYGPYVQSQRRDYYRVFVKHLVAQGKAYPCRMTEEEIERTRTIQQASKKVPGIYGQYAIWRDASYEQQQAAIEKGAPYVIRLRAPSNVGDTIIVFDEIKGETTTQANFVDIVLLKSADGLPTYHMAHLVDDHLMGTTHVIRADEWFSSLPLHIQLFQALGVNPPIYAHVAPFLTLDVETGNKRKLSKRKDKEADVRWFAEQGIRVSSIMAYIMNVIDPSFEEWSMKNPDSSYRDFHIELSHMGQSGALFDIQKLLFLSKEDIAKLDKETFYQEALARAKEYAEPRLYEHMIAEPLYTFAALNIERCTLADPKRYRMYSDIATQLPAFYDAIYETMTLPELPLVCQDEVRMRDFVNDYLATYDLDATKEQWFTHLKECAGRHGFAASNADFKAFGPGTSDPRFVGKVADIAMRLRIKLLKSTTTPDLCESMRVLGKERIAKRLQ